MTAKQKAAFIACAMAIVAALGVLIDALRDDVPTPTWVSADLHMHSYVGTQGNCRGIQTPAPQIFTAISNAQLDVGSPLVWGLSNAEDKAEFTGSDHALSTPDHIMHYDLEVSMYAAARFGHLTMHGLSRLPTDLDKPNAEQPQSTMPLARWARDAQPGALVGFAHVQYWPENQSFPLPNKLYPYEAIPQLALGRLDYLGIEFDPQYLLPFWKTLLNAGYRVPIIGASDYPCTHIPVGGTRTLAKVEGPTTYAKLLSSVREGRTVVSTAGNNDQLDMLVNGKDIGSEVNIAAGATIQFELRTKLSQADTITVQLDGNAATNIAVVAGEKATLFSLPISKSSWVSAKTSRLQTGATYIIVDGKPLRSAIDICYMLRYLAYLRDLVARGIMPAPDALPYYDEAKTKLQQRFAEAGGVTCQWM